MQKQEDQIDSGTVAFWESSYRNSGESGLWGEAHVPHMEQITNQLLSNGYSKILDAPCGEARNLTMLAKRLPFVVGVDSSHTALEAARRTISRRLLSNTLLLNGNLFSLPFIDSQFDAVVCWDVLGHLPRADAAIKELLRVCRPGGKVIGSLFALGDSTRGKDMERIGEEEYLYHGDCYFKYFTEQTVRSLLTPITEKLDSLELVRWTEGPHPIYRPYEHSHESWCFTLPK